MSNLAESLIIGLLLAAVFMAGAGQLVIFNQSWYAQQFNFLNITPDQAQVNNLFTYLAGRVELDNNYYSEREILHLLDVQALLWQAKIISWIIFGLTGLTLITLLLTQGVKKVLKIVFLASLVAVMIYGLILGVLYLGFNQLFEAFHQISFSNDYWQLDPAQDNLINTFPPELFLNLIKQVVGLATLTAMAVFLLTGAITAAVGIRQLTKV